MNACEIELGRAYIANVTRQVYPRPVGVVGYPFSLRRKRPVFKSRTGRQIFGLTRFSGIRIIPTFRCLKHGNPMNLNQFVERLILHHQQGRIEKSSLLSIIEAEGKTGHDFGILEDPFAEKRDTKPFVIGSLNLVAMGLVLTGLWFFFDLIDLSWGATEIAFWVVSSIIVSSLIYFWIKGASNTIMEVHMIFAIGFLVNNYFVTEIFWDFGYIDDFRVEDVILWSLNFISALAILILSNYTANKLDLKFSKVLAGLTFNLPLISIVYFSSMWETQSIMVAFLLILTIVSAYVYVYSRYHQAQTDGYDVGRSIWIHESLIWAAWFVPFIVADAIVQSDAWRATPLERFYWSIVMIVIIASFTGLGLYFLNRNEEQGERNNNYYLAIFYTLSFSWMPIIASRNFVDYIFGDDWIFYWIPPMLFVYVLARVIVGGEPFTTKIPKEEVGLRWFNRTMIALFILYFVCFIIEWLEEFAFYVFIPIGVFIAGYFTLTSLKEDEQGQGNLQE